jgi:glycosyltransferase involved in cell wall biosynthesis
MGDAALYCNPNDVASIAAAIERLVAAPDALAVREELVARGRRRVERYSFERCAGQWVELFARLGRGEAAASSRGAGPPEGAARERAA